MTQASLAQGRIATGAPTEWDIIASRSTMLDQPNSTLGIAYFHGSGSSAQLLYDEPIQRDLLFELAKVGVVFACDFGLQAWGNDTGKARTAEAIAYGETRHGITEWIFVAGSMGLSNALAYILPNPSKVKAVAGIIPLTDIADVRLRGAAASVDAAYPPAYNDATDGPTHSPVLMAANLPPSLPIHIWTCSNDPIVPPATAAAFVAARPQTVRTDLGALGHTNAAMAAAIPGVLEFVNAHR